MVVALEGIKVVDIAQWLAAPMGARILADFGANVIHVEPTVRGDATRFLAARLAAGSRGPQTEVNYLWENYNRNKRGMAVDVSKESGQKIIYKLLEDADVFITNMRPFELERYNLEYETLHQLYPRLIYGNVTGFGKRGPEINEPAFDHSSYWSRGGIPHRLTPPGALPPAFMGAFGDSVCGVHLACGIITALYVRERTGIGQEVYISLFQAGVHQMCWDISGALVTGQDYEDWRINPPEELAAKAKEACDALWDFQRQLTRNPLAMAYKTKDGREITLGMAASDRYWSRFCQAIEQEDLENDPRFASFDAREKNCTELMHILDRVFASKTLDEWKTCLTGKRLVFRYNQNYREIISDPVARANDFFVPVDHPTYGRIEVIANPINLSETSATVRLPAPEFGQHNEEILLEHGYTWEDIEQFKQQSVII